MKSVSQKAASFFHRYWLHILLALALLLVYRGWLRPGPLTYGDWQYHTNLLLREYLRLPFAWEPAVGLGQPNLISLYWFIPQQLLWGMLATLGVPFSWSERLIWFFPCILLAVFGSYYLGKTLFKERKAACITAAAFVLSTYFLRISTVGGVNLGTSFALAPLVLALLIRAKRERGLRYPVLAGLALWLQGSYDLRFCYLTIMVAIAGWILVSVGSLHHERRQGLRDAIRWGSYLALSLGIFIGINLFWILPNVMGPGFQLPSNYGQSWWIPLLSFGKLANGLTMSEQGWPSLTFLQITSKGPLPVNPFFVLIPVIGFGAALAAIRRFKKDPYRAKVALAGAALVLVGAFLVKGSNPPLGGVYIWLFNHLPGFSMFRDANKMMLLVALGYSILLGLSAVIATRWLSERNKLRNWQYALTRASIPIVILLVLCLFVLPALSGHLGGINGTTKPVKVPEGYKELDELLENDKMFYRTFWYPAIQRFAPEGPSHPAISAKDLFSLELAPLATTEKPSSAIGSPLLPGLLDSMAVGQMIVPQDADVPEFRLYRGGSPLQAREIKREYEGQAASIPGNSKSAAYGGNQVFTRKGKDHVFAPEGTVGIIGDWNVALAADGAPGLDLNKSTYLFSQQGHETTSALTGAFPVSAFVSGEQTSLDTVMPFMGGEHLVSVASVADQNLDNGWASFPGGSFAAAVTPRLRSVGFDDRSLDYGLGGAVGTRGYETPPEGWQKKAKHLKTIDAGATPPQMSTGDVRLKLERDTSRIWRGIPTLRGSIGTVPGRRQAHIANSVDIPVKPFNPYGIQFWISGEHLDYCQCKIGFYNAVGERIGEKFFLNTSGTWDFMQISDDFIPIADTAFCRFEIAAKEDGTYSSSWDLSNVDIFDLKGISKHPVFTVSNKTDSKELHHLMVRGIGLQKGGKISLSLDGGREIFLDTYSPDGRMKWYDLGEIELAAGEHSIKVTNLAGENLVNSLALVNEADLSAACRRSSAAIRGRDNALSFDLNRYPDEISYSRGYLTRADTVYCPANAILTPTFPDGGDWARSGINITLGNNGFDLSRSVVQTGVAGWDSLPEVALPKGSCRSLISYPVVSLVGLPDSQRSLTGPSAEWQVSSNKVALSAGISQTGDPSLEGYVPPGDESVERVTQSKRFPVSANTDYSSIFTLEGTDSHTLLFSLKVYDENGNLLDRLALSGEMNGSFSPRTTLDKVRICNGATYAVLEVVCHSNAVKPSTWRLSSLLFNDTSQVESPIKQLVLVPRSWAFPATAAKAVEPVGVEVLKSSPSCYKVRVVDVKEPFLLVFSERSAPDWELQVDGRAVSPVPAYDLLNCYPLYKKGTYEVTLGYRPQKWVNLGLISTILTLAACFAFLLVNHYRRKRKQMVTAKRIDAEIKEE